VFRVPGSGFQVPGSRFGFEVPGSRFGFEVRVRGSGSRFGFEVWVRGSDSRLERNYEPEPGAINYEPELRTRTRNLEHGTWNGSPCQNVWLETVASVASFILNKNSGTLQAASNQSRF
jgi:hypothetical protein